MNTTTIILIILLIVVIVFAIYQRGVYKIRKTIFEIQSVLIDDSLHINERIDMAKSISRQTKGIVFYGIYNTLDAISRELSKKK